MKKLKVCSILNILYASILTVSSAILLVGGFGLVDEFFKAIKYKKHLGQYFVNIIFFIAILLFVFVSVYKLIKSIKGLKDTEKLAQLIEERNSKKVIKGNNIPLLLAIILCPLVAVSALSVKNDALSDFAFIGFIIYLIAIACSIVFSLVRKTFVRIYELELVKKQKEDKQ